ncbi:MAG: hypothetical protein Fues2KO_01540 [Fuerstiella sp.]
MTESAPLRHTTVSAVPSGDSNLFGAAGKAHVSDSFLQTWISRIKASRYGRNVLSNAGSNAFNSVLQLGLLAFLFYHLSETAYAAFLLATFVVGVLEMASDYGTRIWATRSFATATDVRSVLLRSIQCKCCFSLLSGVVFALLPMNSLPATGFWMCVLIAATQPASDPLLWFLRAKERLDVEAGVVMIFRTLATAGILAAAVVRTDLLVFLSIWLVANIGRMVIEWNLRSVEPLRRAPIRRESDIAEFAVVVRAAVPIGTAFVLTSLFQRLSIFLLEAFATPADLKSYGTAFKVVSTSGFVATSICVSSFAMLTRAVSDCDQQRQTAIVRRKLQMVTLLFLPAAMVGTLLTVPMADILRSAELTAVAEVATWLMPGLYVSCINMGLKYTLNAYSLDWQDVLTVLCGSCVLIVTTVCIGSAHWAFAAAIGWFCGELTVAICRIVLLQRQQKHHGVPFAMVSTATLMLCILTAFTAS